MRFLLSTITMVLIAFISLQLATITTSTTFHTLSQTIHAPTQDNTISQTLDNNDQNIVTIDSTAINNELVPIDIPVRRRPIQTLPTLDKSDNIIKSMMTSFKVMNEEEGGEEGGEEGDAEAEEGGNLIALIIILAVVFGILVIVLIVALVTEVHEIICGFFARRAEEKREYTESERFEHQLAATVHWEKKPPGERNLEIV